MIIADGDNKASFSPDYMEQDIEASVSLYENTQSLVFYTPRSYQLTIPQEEEGLPSQVWYWPQQLHPIQLPKQLYGTGYWWKQGEDLRNSHEIGQELGWCGKQPGSFPVWEIAAWQYMNIINWCRGYFIRETNGDNDYTVTYCSAYGHTDNDDMGKFGACT